MLLITVMGMIIVVQRIKRFDKDRDYVVRQNIKDWININRVRVISINTVDCGRNRLSADVRYEVEE